MNDEKLKPCSAESTGVYIRVMCLLHKCDEYGTLTFNELDARTDDICYDFARVLLPHLPYTLEVIHRGLKELTARKVLTIDGERLSQKRMVKDGNTSEERSKAGKKGGGNPNLHKQNPKQTPKQNNKQNTEYENEYEYEDNNTEKGGVGETKNWKTDYEIYHKECHEAFSEFLNNSEKMNQQKELNPGVDVALSIKKGYENFWKTKAGWQHKKKKRTKEIDWEATIINSIDLNKVYLQRNATGNERTRFDIISERTAKAAELMAESDR